MMNAKELADLAETLQTALTALRVEVDTLRERAGFQERRAFYAKLFAPGGAAKLAELRAVLKDFDPSVPASIDEVNEVVAEIAGADIEFSAGDIEALEKLFFHESFLPIRPVGGSQDEGFREFYEKVLSTDEGIGALKDLQTNVAPYWATNNPPVDLLIAQLKEVTPNVTWDARHVFALWVLLTYDVSMRPMAPYFPDPSVW